MITPYCRAMHSLETMMMIARRNSQWGSVKAPEVTHTESLEDDGVLLFRLKVGGHGDEADENAHVDGAGASLEDAVGNEAHIVQACQEPGGPDETAGVDEIRCGGTEWTWSHSREEADVCGDGVESVDLLVLVEETDALCGGQVRSGTTGALEREHTAARKRS
jgi:hypothetical protein